MLHGSSDASDEEVYLKKLYDLFKANPSHCISDHQKTDDEMDKTHRLHYLGLESYEPIQSAFDSFGIILKQIEEQRLKADRNTSNREKPRTDMVAIHGTPGLGKSTFLDHFCDKVYDWKKENSKSELLREAPDWLRDCVIVPITYNSNSKYSSDVEKGFKPQETLSLRVLWSYFYKKSCVYVNFCNAFNRKIRVFGKLPSLSQAIRVIQKHQSHLKNVNEESIRILLLVDEPMMFKGSRVDTTPEQREALLEPAIDFLKIICGTMDEIRGLTVILTSLDELLTENASRESHRKARWIQLRTLDIQTAYMLLLPMQKALSRSAGDPERIQRLIKRCAVETSGHPRAIEAVYDKLKSLLVSGATDGERLDEMAHHNVLNAIVEDLPVLELPAINASTFALGLLGEQVDADFSVKANTSSAGMKNPKVADLVAAGVYVHSAASKGPRIPQLSGLLVRRSLFNADSNTFATYEQNALNKLIVDSPADAPGFCSLEVVKSLLTRLLELEPDFGTANGEAKINCGDPFERFHCLLELIKQHVRLICWLRMDFLDSASRIIRGTYVCASLQEHYLLSKMTPESGPKWNVLESDVPLTSKSKITGSLRTRLWWPLLSTEDSDEVDNVRSFEDLLAAVRNAKRRATDPNPVYTRNDLFPFLIRRSPKDWKGFDASMLVRVDPSAGAEATAGHVWCILVECKHSDPVKSKQRLDIDTLRHKLETLKDFVPQLLKAGADRVVYVVTAWRDFDADLYAGVFPEI